MAEPSWFKYYGMLPVWSQNVACSLMGLRMRRSRFNGVFREFLAFAEDFQWLTLDEQRAYQDQKIFEVVRHAYESVPYYRRVMDERKLAPSDIRGIDDLRKLPILTKELIRKHGDELLSRAVPKGRWEHGQTGGTTGTALRLVWDVELAPKKWATWWRHRHRFGVNLGDPYISFAGRNVVPLACMKPPFWRRNFPLCQTYVSIHHMTRQNMKPLVDYLQSRKVVYYNGYPSALYLLARYLQENGIQLRHPPQIVFTGAETLLPHQRAAIEAALNTRLSDMYGAAELSANIAECEKHRYHFDMEFGAIELLPLAGVDNARRIICTGLHNPVMPLIRYDIGDLATIDNGPACECGRAAPTVASIDGRIESYIVTPDGRQLGRLDFLFKDSHQIREAQLVQDEPDHVTVKLVRTDRYSERDERRLWRDLRAYLGRQIRIDIEYLEEIPRASNGKFRQIVSAVFPDYCREEAARRAACGTEVLQ